MDWRNFLLTATKHFSLNPGMVFYSWSWCSWTTFTRVGEDAGYWTAALPLEADLLEQRTADGGMWGQPFRYDDLAHIVIPRRFLWENTAGDNYEAGIHEQDINGLSQLLTEQHIPHRVSDIILEAKIY